MISRIFCVRPLAVSVIYLTFLTLCPPGLQAQQLEEVIVTAQRREQSLQEVPVSVEVHTGAQLIEQGFDTLDDLAAHSPSAEITNDIIRFAISIRG